ncbi:MAG: hypothetical protein QOC65_215 [Sphingomonadales bacterium]|nr:hypothetical protein [Sphingomonadales bacterium]
MRSMVEGWKSRNPRVRRETAEACANYPPPGYAWPPPHRSDGEANHPRMNRSSASWASSSVVWTGGCLQK